MTTINVKLKPIDPKAPGFLPRYRQLVASKRVFQDFAHAVPEDVDEACKLLKEHIVEPVGEQAKDAYLASLDADEVMDLFNKVMGSGTVPPVNGAA